MTRSARFLANLSGYATPRWRTEVDWSNDGGASWQPATLVGGSATASATSQIRWTSTIDVLDVPFGRGINPYQTRYRIRQGMVFSDHEQPEWVGLGVYRVSACRRSSAQPGRISITGESFESYLIRSTLTKPRTIYPAPAAQVLNGLIKEVLPKALIGWGPDVDINLMLPKLVAVTNRWATIDGDKDSQSIAKSLGARVFCDGSGIFRVESVPTLADPISWEATEGPGGVSLGVTEDLSSEGVTNVEVVVGTPSGTSVVIGPGVAKDLDPNSLTFVGRSPDQGGYGVAPAEEYQSQMVTSLAQAQKVAQARLAAKLGLKQQLTFSTLHDPTKAPGQVGLIHGLGAPQLALLDSVPYDLSATPGPMECQTRTTQTRLLGDTYISEDT